MNIGPISITPPSGNVVQLGNLSFNVYGEIAPHIDSDISDEEFARLLLANLIVGNDSEDPKLLEPIGYVPPGRVRGGLLPSSRQSGQ
jgi:hypothetical protein